MKLPVAVLCAAACAVFVPATSEAAGKVYRPYAVEGELEFESQYVNEDGNVHELELAAGYGFSGRWAGEIEAELEAEDGGGFRLHALAVESWVTLAPRGAWWADAALFGKYETKLEDGSPDEFKAGLLVEKLIGRTLTVGNIFLEKETGAGAGDEVEASYAVQTRWRLGPHFEPGIELQGKLGDISDLPALREQEHVLGPAVFGRYFLGPGRAVKYEAAALFGLTEASPNTALRLAIELEFYL